MDPFPNELFEAAARRLSLDPYSHVPRFVLVIDADATLSSIHNHCRTSIPPRLLRIAASTRSRVYASEHVLSEIYAGFAKLSSPAASAEQMQSRFEREYLPRIRWVSIDDSEVRDERVAEVTDRTDIPTAQLASLIAPCLVLSEDKSLRSPGFAPSAWRDAAAFGARVVEAADEQAQATLALGLPAAFLIGGALELGKKVGLPWWITAAILCAGGFIILRDPRRRGVVGKYAMTFAEAVGTKVVEIANEEQAGTEALRGLLVSPTPHADLKQRIATLLARASQPLLAAEILDLVVTHFAKDMSPAPTLAEIRWQLRTCPEFSLWRRYRWQLGRRAGRLRRPPEVPGRGV
jgi:hypothetical protein